MRKIPTLFKRDPDNMKHVLPEVTPGCEWVLAGEGVATRKYDGTCVMLNDDGWWARREVKPGKQPPAGFVAVQTDENTGKTVGWEPVEQSPFVKFWREAVDRQKHWSHGTYELVGPKVQGNPEQYDRHHLVLHDLADKIPVPDLSFEGVRAVVLHWRERYGMEGLVWHHPDGRMAKIKARDFPAHSERSRSWSACPTQPSARSRQRHDHDS